MPWTKTDYPASMKNLTPEVRQKAIDIANALVEDKYDDGRAIAIATAQAEKWANNRKKRIRKPNAEGTTGQALESGPETDDAPIHLVPDPERAGWVVQQEERRLAQGQDKGDVLNKARDKATSQHVPLYIHDEDGKVVEEENN